MKNECAENNFKRYFDNKKLYPEEAFIQKTSGRVTAQFVVNALGKVERIKILKGVGYGCDVDLISVLEELNNAPKAWIPGYLNKKPVSTLKTISVKYEPV